MLLLYIVVLTEIYIIQWIYVIKWIYYMNPSVHLWQYLVEFFLEREMFQTRFVKKITTHVLCSETFSLKSYRISDDVENLWYSQTDHSNNTTLRMRFASSVTKDKRTLRIYNHHCFSTGTTDMRTRLFVTFPRAFPLLFSFMLKYSLIV